MPFSYLVVHLHFNLPFAPLIWLSGFPRPAALTGIDSRMALCITELDFDSTLRNSATRGILGRGYLCNSRARGVRVASAPPGQAVTRGERIAQLKPEYHPSPDRGQSQQVTSAPLTWWVSPALLLKLILTDAPNRTLTQIKCRCTERK